MGKYSAKKLHCMDGHQISIGSELLSVFLARIFSRFDDEPTGWIYAGKNCCFIVGPGRKPLEASHVPRGDLAPHIVLLPSDIYKRYEKNRCGTIMLVLHEVAHGYLDHYGNISSKVYRQQELDAWKLAAKWYRSSELPKSAT